MKIIGNTVGMGLPKPNLMQTDPAKGDYVKGKEEFVEQFGSGSGGSAGVDGFSPIANVTQTEDGAVISITDKDGTTTATVTNGKDGADGNGIKEVGSTTSTDPGGTNKLTFTMDNGQKFTLLARNGQNGQNGQQGIQGRPGIDGTSVTVSSVSESTEDGGSNVVTFSDGKTVTVKNGQTGSKGDSGVYILADGETVDDAPADASVIIDPNGSADSSGSGGLEVGGGSSASQPSSGATTGGTKETILNHTFAEASKEFVYAFTEEEIAKVNSAKKVRFLFDANNGTVAITGVTFGIHRPSWYGYAERFFNNVTFGGGSNSHQIGYRIYTNDFHDGYGKMETFQMVSGVSGSAKTDGSYRSDAFLQKGDSLKLVTTLEAGFPVGTIVKVEVIA